jgi:hypothetical protein
MISALPIRRQFLPPARQNLPTIGDDERRGLSLYAPSPCHPAEK